MRDFVDYAIYFAPQGPLAEFGASRLGWDPAVGEGRTHPDVAGLPRPVEEITAPPRRYEFHGRLKPPFRLAAGSAPAVCDGLAPARIGTFLDLVPIGNPKALTAPTARVVRDLDGFRAPPAASELERRRQAGLPPREDHLLLR